MPSGHRTDSALGRYFPLPFWQGPAHHRGRVILLSALAVFFIFLACIPAIVIPVRRHNHSHSSLSTSSTNNSTNNSSSTSPEGPITIPIAPVPFTPFPVPSDTPIPGVFPVTNPSKPPPVSEAPGLGGLIPDFAQAWKTAKAKAKAKLANYTLEQKVAITTGVGWENGRCVGNIPAVADFPGLCLEVRRSAHLADRDLS